MKITNIEGPFPDSQTFQPYLRVTLNMPLEVTAQERTQEQNDLIIGQALRSAFEEWNHKKQMPTTP